MQRRQFLNCQWMIASRLRRTGSSLETRSCPPNAVNSTNNSTVFSLFSICFLGKKVCIKTELRLRRREKPLGRRYSTIILCFFVLFCVASGDGPYRLATRHSHSVARYKFRVISTCLVVLGSSWTLTTAWAPTSQKRALRRFNRGLPTRHSRFIS